MVQIALRHLLPTNSWGDWLSAATCILGLSASCGALNRVSDQPSLGLTVITRDLGLQNDTAPNLYGIMFEDINHSGDGGIYAELLMNRAFQGGLLWGRLTAGSSDGPNLDGWAGIGDITISFDRLHPPSNALPIALKVHVPANATGEVGLRNNGWWGMDVSPGRYDASFYVVAEERTHRNVSTTFDLSLRSAEGQIWGSSPLTSHLPTFDYTRLNTSIFNEATAPDANNSFVFTWKAEETAGQTLYFSFFSLFPETFKDRPNGLRKDLAEALYDLHPKFLRFPGGNNLEGESVKTRWKWWETIGPLVDRPGRWGDWEYANTDGLGLMEYMYWCEDMEMEPLLGIYAGYSLDGTSYPPERMHEVLQEALDELEFLTGDVSTPWGAKRAEYGHPEPWKIKYVEIGNEDYVCSYRYRFPYLYKGLKEAYPEILFISTTFDRSGDENCPFIMEIPPGEATDIHYYGTPAYFYDNFDQWDNFADRYNLSAGAEVTLLEYSVYELDPIHSNGEKHPVLPQMVHALGEGVYQLSMERNPGLVTMAAYAPVLQNINKYQWSPNMLAFTAAGTLKSTSYWQQWLFARYRGTQTVPVHGTLDPLFWAGSIDNGTGIVYVKIINTSNKSTSITLDFDAEFASVNGTTLRHDDPHAYNTFEEPGKVAPRALKGAEEPQAAGALSWSWTVGAYSSSVLQFNPE